MENPFDNPNDNDVFNVTFHNGAVEITFMEKNGSSSLAQHMQTITVIYRNEDGVVNGEIDNITFTMLEMLSHVVDLGVMQLRDSVAAEAEQDDE